MNHILSFPPPSIPCLSFSECKTGVGLRFSGGNSVGINNCYSKYIKEREAAGPNPSVRYSVSGTDPRTAVH